MFPYMSLAIAYFRAGRFAEANAICEQAVKSKHDGGDLHAVLLSLAFVNGDDSAVQRELDLFTAVHDPGFKGIQAQMAFTLGQVRKGREIFLSSRATRFRPQDLP